MAPKAEKRMSKNKAGGSSIPPVKKIGKGDKESVMGLRGEFDPDDILDEDKCTFNVESKDKLCYFRFMTFILGLRYKAAEGCKKCKGEKFNHKCRLGEFSAYQVKMKGKEKGKSELERPAKGEFMLITYAVDGKYEVGYLMWKPSCYLVAICVDEEWYSVKDFSQVTRLDFPKSQPLYFECRYSGAPRVMSFWVLLNSIKDTHNMIKDAHNMAIVHDSFKNVCVLTSECMRFDELLLLIVENLKSSQVDSIALELSVEQASLILSWSTLSILWVLYDLGYAWNTEGKSCYGSATPEKCRDALGLVCDCETDVSEITAKFNKEIDCLLAHKPPESIQH